jgi:hypothetical protein
MKKIVFLFLIFSCACICQNAKMEGVSNASTAVKNKLLLSPANPAALSFITNRFVSINAAPQLFGLKELSKYSIGYAEPMEIGNFSLNINSFGYDLYKNYSPELIYAKQLYKSFSAGIKIHYEYINIKNYGSDGALGIDLGGLIELSEKLSLGFAAINLNSPKMGMNNENLEQILRMGIAWEPVNEFVLDIDMVKDLDFPLSALFGFSYLIIKNLEIRAGINTYPSSYSAGISFYYSRFNIDYALSVHNELGSTHFIGLNILLNGSSF